MCASNSAFAGTTCREIVRGHDRFKAAQFSLMRCLVRVRGEGACAARVGKRKVESNMTLTASIPTAKAKIDWTKPVLWLFAACLVALIVLPLSWLAVYSVTDKANHPTLQNFVKLFTDPDFLDPLLPTAIIATTSAAICFAVAPPIAWLGS